MGAILRKSPPPTVKLHKMYNFEEKSTFFKKEIKYCNL